MDHLPRLELALLAALAEAAVPLTAPMLQPQVATRLGTIPNRGAVTRALAALERRKFVSSRPGSPAAHGGPRRVFFRITPDGRERFLYEREALTRCVRVHRTLSPATRAFLQNPPRGTKTAEARDYGVDLVHIARAAEQTPQERFREGVAAMRAFEKFRR